MLLIAWAIAIGLEFSCAGCGHVSIYDKEFCGDLGKYGAHCGHSLIDQKRDLTKDQWDEERIGWMCTDARGYSDTETSIDQLCATTNLCDYETQKKIEAMKARIRPVVKKALAAKRRKNGDIK